MHEESLQTMSFDDYDQILTTMIKSEKYISDRRNIQLIRFDDDLKKSNSCNDANGLQVIIIASSRRRCSVS